MDRNLATWGRAAAFGGRLYTATRFVRQLKTEGQVSFLS